ncbi:MAG: BON domain-containing protein [Bacteroidota bacterium]
MKRLLTFLRGSSASTVEQTAGQDRAIAYRLQQRFERRLDPVRIDGFQFYVQHRVVSIYGTVHSRLDRDLLISLVRDVPGVIATESHIQVIRLATPARAEAQVRQRVAMPA